MRSHARVCLVGAGLLLGACSGNDRATAPTGPTESPQSPSFANSTTTGPVCGAYPATQAQAIQQILTELGYVYPRFSPPLLALQVISNLLGVALGKAQQIPAQQFAVQIINRLQSDLNGGKLRNPPSSGPFATATLVVDDLIKRLQCLTMLPVTGNSQDFGVGVVTPNTASTIVTGNQTGGAYFPPGSVDNTTVVTIQRLPNGPTLLTTLDQFPAFYKIQPSNNAQLTHNNQVIVGICNVANDDGYAVNGNLLVAHNLGTNFGDVEVLPPATAGFLDCTKSLASAAGRPRSLAAASWHAVSDGLGSFARTLFLPAELHATILLGGGPGGYTGKFSPFGTIDINSNPAKLIIVDAVGNPAPSGVVTGEGPTYTVYVKAISSGAHYAGGYLNNTYASPNPIQGVPVSFGGGTPRATNASGIASFDWTPSGANASLTATVPNEEGCPTAPSTPESPTPVPNPFRPPVCFTPNSVTFITPDLLPPSFGASGWTYLQVANAGAAPANWQTLALPAAAPWAIGSAAFGTTGCGLTAPVTTWDVGTSILLRRDVYVPANVTSATISVRIDNDVQVWVNGFDVSGYRTHEGCANDTPPGPFTVSASSAGPTSAIPLHAGAVNKIAILGVDRGVQAYVDVQITLQTPSP